MDLQGSLVDTNLRIYPSENLTKYLNSLKIDENVPTNIAKLVKGKDFEHKYKSDKEDAKTIPIHLNSKDIENLKNIRATVKVEEPEVIDNETISEEETVQEAKNDSILDSKDKSSNSEKHSSKTKNSEKLETDKDSDENKKQQKEVCNEKVGKEENVEEELYLSTSDIDWLYEHLQKLRSKGQTVPYLHELLEGVNVATPKNAVIKRNPVLEARCVKLRAQQESREYRKMTKSVDNVRMRFPEDSINYQLKQVNRQLIAIGQFIISIFAGFLFGFKGVEWMIGHLDFGFRLLLGVMCALIIALAEIYFLAKKLNEELNIPETVQLGGPPKFADQHLQENHYAAKTLTKKANDKEHQD